MPMRSSAARQQRSLTALLGLISLLAVCSILAYRMKLLSPVKMLEQDVEGNPFIDTPLTFDGLVQAAPHRSSHNGQASTQAAYDSSHEDSHLHEMNSSSIKEGTSVTFPEVVAVKSSKYLRDSSAATYAMNAVRNRLRAHIASPAYQERLEKVRRRSKRGILINAGGAIFLTNLIVTLKVLREVHNCTMDVEVFWQGGQEMDAATLASLQRNFGPLEGHDIMQLQHPVQGLHTSGVDLAHFTGKVYSLLHTSFSEVIMIDADSLPVQSPDVFFQHPQVQSMPFQQVLGFEFCSAEPDLPNQLQEFCRTGSLFWPDAWTELVHEKAFRLAGLDHHQAKHLDVVEYVFWLNSFSEDLKAYMWGDKDTFPLAFAAAGKAHLFSQVAVPPAGAFKWRKDMLLIKSTGQRTWGWHLLGFLQHDSWGRPAFFHRTINKFRLTEVPWEVELITAPMPRRWIEYYLAHNSLGPTRGVPWDYVVPGTAVHEMSLVPLHTHAGRAVWEQGECPAVAFASYWAMREAALGIDQDADLEERCRPVLQRMLGEATYREYASKGYLSHPGLRFMAAGYLEDGESHGPSKEPDGTPLPAWRPNCSTAHPEPRGQFARSLRASYAAYAWLLQNRHQFPVLGSGGGV